MAWRELDGVGQLALIIWYIQAPIVHSLNFLIDKLYIEIPLNSGRGGGVKKQLCESASAWFGSGSSSASTPDADPDPT